MSQATIRVLPSDLIDRIAAGEVIERPASVVKELLENAVDAGGRALRVELEGGGLARIQVSDDARGMSRADAQLCVLRHATSKLAAPDDLFAIHTLGFRGEALSSIASVSRMTITTRRREDAVGTRVVIEGGELRAVEDAGCPPGTTVDVRDLFFNTPARRKFMRSPATEQAHVIDVALRVVLGAEGAGVVVSSGERRLLDVPEGAAPGERVMAALGARVDEVFPFDGALDGVRVHGFVTRPELDRADAKGMWFFVNGRYVRDRVLQRAALDGYRSMVEKGRYPIVVVHVDVDPGAVDVNVHPQKLEVRFSDGSAVFRAVSAALTSVLARTPWIRDGHDPATRVRRATEAFFAAGPEAPAWRAGEARPTTYAANAPRGGARMELGLGDGSATSAELPGTEARGYFSRLRPLGQGLGLYLVCDGGDELVLIDQHAAHERVAYEKLRRQAEREEVARQPLLFPEVLEVSERLQAVLEERWQSLLGYGFEVEPVGPGRFAVRAIPAALSGANARALVNDLLDELDGLEEAGAGAAARDASARIFSRCACHAVVRAGDVLEGREIRALLDELDRIDFGANCPHGRPVYHRVPRRELDRIFHRG